MLKSPLPSSAVNKPYIPSSVASEYVPRSVFLTYIYLICIALYNIYHHNEKERNENAQAFSFNITIKFLIIPSNLPMGKKSYIINCQYNTYSYLCQNFFSCSGEISANAFGWKKALHVSQIR